MRVVLICFLCFLFVFTWWNGRVHDRQRETVQIRGKVKPFHVLVTPSSSMRLEFRHQKLWWLIRLFFWNRHCISQVLQRNGTYKAHAYIYMRFTIIIGICRYRDLEPTQSVLYKLGNQESQWYNLVQVYTLENW